MELSLLKKSKPLLHVKNMMEKKSPENSENLAEESILTISLKLLPQRMVQFLFYSVLNAIEKCVGDVESLAHDENIKGLDKT